MLTIEFIPYSQIEHMNSDSRLRKIIDIVKKDKIALLEGRLKKQEEADLIKRTMEEIDKEFTGIELSVLYPNERSSASLIRKIRDNIVTLLVGDRQGFTIIGPASIVKEIKKDPNKIQLLTQERKKAIVKKKRK